MIGTYTTIKGNSFTVAAHGSDRFVAAIADRRMVFTVIESAEYFSAEVRATGASHVLRSGADRMMILIDTATADRLSADLAAAKDAARAAAIAEAKAQPGARFVVAWSNSGHPASVGIAAPSAAHREGVYRMLTIAELTTLKLSDIPTDWIGKTSQDDYLAEISEAELDRLRALDNERKGVVVEAEAAERALIAAYGDIVAAIPADIAAERDALRADHHRGQNEGGDGYDPYDGWTGPASLALLNRRLPTAADAIRDLQRRGL